MRHLDERINRNINNLETIGDSVETISPLSASKSESVAMVLVLRRFSIVLLISIARSIALN